MLFLDGVGVGTNNPEINPFFAATLPALGELCGGNMIHLRHARRSSSSASITPIAATLGTEGLPQSGTGQTALMTGVNAASLIGKHFGPYPYSSLHAVIDEKNIFRRLRDAGRSVLYANAFPKKYFDYYSARRGRTPALARSWISSGFELNNVAALAEGKALSADITGRRWNENGFGRVPELSPQEAGRRLVTLGNRHDFVLFEYSFTDHAGHSQSMPQAIEVLALVDEFIGGIVEAMRPESTTLIVASDHGNIEDLSTKTHTRNPVPFIAVGRHHAAASHRVHDISDVPVAIEYLLK
jgi:hypothetical protein